MAIQAGTNRLTARRYPVLSVITKLEMPNMLWNAPIIAVIQDARGLIVQNSSLAASETPVNATVSFLSTPRKRAVNANANQGQRGVKRGTANNTTNATLAKPSP